MTDVRQPTAPLRDVPVDWEALEDAFENNAPEVHSYLHLTTGEVLRVVDGVADPHMHARISADPHYLRIDPVSSREQYRWMERFIPMVDTPDLRDQLGQAIDGKGAFRRFKDVLMSYAEDRERWFAFRSERLRTFMEAWLTAHAIKAVPRPTWAEPPLSSSIEEAAPESVSEGVSSENVAPISTRDLETEGPKSQSGRRQKSADGLRQNLKELGDALGSRELDLLVSFAEFLKARRAARGFVHHHEHMREERDSQSQRAIRISETTPSASVATGVEKSTS